MFIRDTNPFDVVSVERVHFPSTELLQEDLQGSRARGGADTGGGKLFDVDDIFSPLATIKNQQRTKPRTVDHPLADRSLNEHVATLSERLRETRALSPSFNHTRYLEQRARTASSSPHASVCTTASFTPHSSSSSASSTTSSSSSSSNVKQHSTTTLSPSSSSSSSSLVEATQTHTQSMEDIQRDNDEFFRSHVETPIHPQRSVSVSGAGERESELSAVSKPVVLFDPVTGEFPALEADLKNVDCRGDESDESELEEVSFSVSALGSSVPLSPLATPAPSSRTRTTCTRTPHEGNGHDNSSSAGVIEFGGGGFGGLSPMMSVASPSPYKTRGGGAVHDNQWAPGLSPVQSLEHTDISINNHSTSSILDGSPSSIASTGERMNMLRLNVSSSAAANSASPIIDHRTTISSSSPRPVSFSSANNPVTDAGAATAATAAADAGALLQRDPKGMGFLLPPPSRKKPTTANPRRLREHQDHLVVAPFKLAHECHAHDITNHSFAEEGSRMERHEMSFESGFPALTPMKQVVDQTPMAERLAPRVPRSILRSASRSTSSSSSTSDASTAKHVTFSAGTKPPVPAVELDAYSSAKHKEAQLSVGVGVNVDVEGMDDHEDSQDTKRQLDFSDDYIESLAELSHLEVTNVADLQITQMRESMTPRRRQMRPEWQELKPEQKQEQEIVLTELDRAAMAIGVDPYVILQLSSSFDKQQEGKVEGGGEGGESRQVQAPLRTRAAAKGGTEEMVLCVSTGSFSSNSSESTSTSVCDASTSTAEDAESLLIFSSSPPPPHSSSASASSSRVLSAGIDYSNPDVPPGVMSGVGLLVSCDIPSMRMSHFYRKRLLTRRLQRDALSVSESESPERLLSHEQKTTLLNSRYLTHVPSCARLQKARATLQESLDRESRIHVSAERERLPLRAKLGYPRILSPSASPPPATGTVSV